jgi:hypothetical protein
MTQQVEKSPQLVTYKVLSITIPDMREEIDILIRENSPPVFQTIKEWLVELYGKHIVVMMISENTVQVELKL